MGLATILGLTVVLSILAMVALGTTALVFIRIIKIIIEGLQ